MQIYTKMLLYELTLLVRDKTKTNPYFVRPHVFSSSGLPKYLSFLMNKMSNKPRALSPLKRTLYSIRNKYCHAGSGSLSFNL